MGTVNDNKATTTTKAGLPRRNPNKPKMTKEERRAKYTDIARKRRQKQQGFRRQQQGGGGRFGNHNTPSVCYACRQPGHTIANCPTKAQEQESSNSAVLCYKCGSTEHALKDCPKRGGGGNNNNNNNNDLPFATCFLCQEKGHLASSCPTNSHGIYVNGGSCKHCGSQQHLATNCPEKKTNKKKKGEGRVEEEDIEDLLEAEGPDPSSSTKKKKNKQKSTSPSIEVSPPSSSTDIKTNKAAKEETKPKNKKRKVVNF